MNINVSNYTLIIKQTKNDRRYIHKIIIAVFRNFPN